MSENICPICGKADCLLRDDPSNYKYIACKTFGYQFSVDDDLLALPLRERNKLLNLVFEFLCNTPLCRHEGKNLKWFFFNEPTYKCQQSDPPNYINIAELQEQYPSNFTERTNRILMNLFRKWPNMDDEIYIDDTCGRLVFCESDDTEDEAKTLMTHLISLGLIEGDVRLGYYRFMAQGWKLIEKLTQEDQGNAVNQGIHPFIELSHALPELEKEMAPTGGNLMPGLKTIYTNPQFTKWRAEIKYQLQQLKSMPAVTEALSLLDAFNGWNDERTFQNVKASIETIATHLDDFLTKGDDVKVIDNKKVFIVHGHNEKVRNDVELFLRRLELKPIILLNEADRGRTVIEKFENNSDVSFAVILYTACDEGRVKGADVLNDRARQNVIFEHGFFCAKLGRDHVVALHESGVEIPSDLAGVLYTSFADDWKTKLKREMSAAGIEADWTKD